MIEENIDVNKVFKKGFDTCHVDPGISSISKKRILRLLPDSDIETCVESRELQPPANNLIDEIQHHLMGVLKLFATNPSSINKNVTIHRVPPGEKKAIKSPQWLQPAIGVILLMPEKRQSSFRISRVKFKNNGDIESKEEVAVIPSDQKKITVTVFNASSMIYSWETPVNKTEYDQVFISMMFEELQND